MERSLIFIPLFLLISPVRADFSLDHGQDIQLCTSRMDSHQIVVHRGPSPSMSTFCEKNLSSFIFYPEFIIFIFIANSFIFYF
mmetsp:Transcript_9947/g.17630  ORF Transcript_9947/g.17630 Transcript_9947/m.17630 type:complete len:83 (-) Transcript_9947:29-277(-)